MSMLYAPNLPERPDRMHWGRATLGVLGSDVLAGSIEYASLDLPADNAKRFRAFVPTWPVAGTMLLDEDGVMSWSGLADGTYSFAANLIEDGVTLSPSITVSVTVGVAAIPVAFSGTVPAQTATVGTAFSLALAPYFSGNRTPFTYTLASGALPAGLALNASTGAISGTPSAAGSGSFTVRATDTASNQATTNSIAWTVGALSAALSASLVAQATCAGALTTQIVLRSSLVGTSTLAGDLTTAPREVNMPPPGSIVRARPRILGVFAPAAFSPKDPAEVVTLAFDFSPLIGKATITACSVGAMVYRGLDAAPAATLAASADALGSVVLQRVQGGVAGVTYRLKAQIDASDGNRYVLAGLLPVRVA